MLEGAIVIMPEDLYLLSEKSEQIIEALQKKKDMLQKEVPIVVTASDPSSAIVRAIKESHAKYPVITIEQPDGSHPVFVKTNVSGIMYDINRGEFVVFTECSSREVCRTSYPEVARSALATYSTEYLEDS